MHPVLTSTRSSRRIRRVSPLLIAMLAVAATLITGAGVTAAINPAQATVHTKEIEVAMNGLAKGTVRCPAGMRVISGGVAFHRPDLPPAALSAKLISSSPTADARGWHGAGTSFEDLPILMRITAVCLPKRSVGSYTVRTKDLTADGALRSNGSLSCGRGKRIVTGGAFWNPGAGGPAPTAADNLLRSGPRDGSRWVVSGFSYGGPDDTLRIVLLCRPTASLGSVSIRTRDLTGGLDRDGSVSCPAGKRAIAGGVDWIEGGRPIASGGSLTSSSVRSSRTGWYAAGHTAPDIVMRLRVICIRK